MASSSSRYALQPSRFVSATPHDTKTSTTPGQAITSSNRPPASNMSPCQPMPAGFNAQMPRRIGWLSTPHLTHPSLSRYGLNGPRRSRTCHTAARSPHHHISLSNNASTIPLLGPGRLLTSCHLRTANHSLSSGSGALGLRQFMHTRGAQSLDSVPIQ
ncbi:hypothetical protein K505DRAFT_329853 [Melanomma pulvis-pyrius CBS 109.77]|uniref:Uncharacterized protein n=1 Tax=Melanomma pulvis-pyrius CBS 109.77 TaxID=1314802 RepID=A0A6A6WSV6_9PLEO|nr:hypothetical protein K505DRAFT_329853 [Melanomma pulvis-pyrius CBS 109.77]